jgi:2',3'-cyclic-nucleotide 2'-phosphodiesterase (5'-nucleotidase family)
MMRRRIFLRGSAFAGAGVLLPRGGFGQEEGVHETATISILHTTDLHGHVMPTSNYRGEGDLGGLARCAAQIRTWRKESPANLLIDIGDVYQGTPVGWQTRGRLMIDLFNKLHYDAWVLGNHEFDWGPEVVLDALTRSKMPVLTGNMKLEGKLAGTWEDEGHPFAQILPHMVKEVGGYKIGLVGMVTPGLPYWLRPELLKGFEVLPPAEMLKASVKFLREEAKVDAVVVCGHMGLQQKDDFANPTRSLLEGESGVDVFIGGHTHRHQESRDEGGVLYTQADYFGIHCGRVDLTFNLGTGQLVAKKAVTALMDARIKADPVVIEASANDVEDAKTYMSAEVGVVELDISHNSGGKGKTSPLQELISSAIEHGAAKDGLVPDGVFHGTFGSGTLDAGKKSMADLWKVLPYENRVVALYLTREEITAVLNESLQVRSDRALYGFEVEFSKSEAAKFEDRGETFVRSLRSLRSPGKEIGHRYCILCNAYDAQSGGKRLMRLRALAESPECKATLLTLSSREALIDYFQDAGTVRPSALKAKGD